MQNKQLPVRKIVSCLNDEEAECGGFWLPNKKFSFMLRSDTERAA